LYEDAMMEEIKQILKTTWGKVIAAIAAGAVAALGYLTDLGTDWSKAAQEDLGAVIESRE
jgi:hypothetical protein